VAGGERDHLAEELFIDLAQDVGGEDGKFVGGIGVVKVLDNVLENFVVDGEGGSEFVGRVGSVFFPVEVEEAGIVAFVGTVVEGEQPLINTLAVQEGLELGVGFDAAIFGDAEEDKPVDGALDGKIELAVGEGGIAEGEVAGQGVAPGFDLGEEGGIDLGGAFLAFGGFYVFVEGAFEDGVARKDRCDVVPAFAVLVVGEVEGAGGGGFVGFYGFDAGVIDGEFLEVGKDGERQFGAPGVASELASRKNLRAPPMRKQ